MVDEVKATIADIIKVMEFLAPNRLAEEWDNVGLQIGDLNRPVQTIRVALDPTPDTVDAAAKDGVDLLITHHPLIFHPLKVIDLDSPMGFIIQTAVLNRMTIFSAHTNLDSAAGGLNDILAHRIGLNDVKVLGNAKQTENYKLVFYVPEAYQQTVMTALFETRAGEIGNYSCCSFRNKGKGTYKPEPLSKPFTGKIGEISHADEIRIETVVRKNDVTSIIDHIRKNHPYETMAYDIYPLLPHDHSQGLGRIGKIKKSMDLKAFALSIKSKLGLHYLKIAGNPDLSVETVAVCSGSGSGLFNQFVASGAQVYVSGDLRYHDAKTAEALNLGLIDIGHFASEHLIVDVLTRRLKKVLSEAGMDVKIEAYKLEQEPFMIL
jgi:dinuclear metal center YbgI/SA1388 family protein